MKPLGKPIGILGGTFDPIHNAHLYLASSALSKLNLEKILFIPSYLPVHRDPPQAGPEDRKTMVALAIKPYPEFVLDLREMQRIEPSYMIDTARSLREDFPQNPLCLLIGADAFAEIDSWKSWQALFDYFNFVVMTRKHLNEQSSFDLFIQSRLTQQLSDLSTHLAGQVFLLTDTPCPISATLIRTRIKNKDEISDLVPKEVAAYIQTKGLYR